MTDWRPSERSQNGGVDRIPLPDGTAGGLWLCGKHFVGPDVERAIERTEATAVVCLNEAYELDDRYPEYVDWLRTDERAVWHPIPDLHAPAAEDARHLVDDLRARIEEGDTLLVHCGAGVGRAGTVAVAILLALGVDLETAAETVAAARPTAGPEAGAQRALLEALAAMDGEAGARRG